MWIKSVTRRGQHPDQRTAAAPGSSGLAQPGTPGQINPVQLHRVTGSVLCQW